MHHKFYQNYNASSRFWWYLFCVFLLRAGQSLGPSSHVSNNRVSSRSSSVRGDQRQKIVGGTNYQLVISSKLEVGEPVKHLKHRQLQLSNATATGETVVNTAKNVTDAVATVVTGTLNEVQGTPPNQWSTTAWIIVVVVVVASLCLICCVWNMIC